jgi:hypothetical protein
MRLRAWLGYVSLVVIACSLVVLEGREPRMAPSVSPGAPSEQPAAAPTAETGTTLYRFAIIQAAPGRLIDLIDLHRKRVPVTLAGGDEAPFIVRHSQGDHWDLVVIWPTGSFVDFYSAERVRKREAAGSASGVSDAEFNALFRSMVAWTEDVYLAGPPVADFRAFVKDAGLAHFEMLMALAGKREALVDERKRENAYNRGRGRPTTMIFVREQGAAWDVITLDVFRNWRHFAEQETIAPEVNDGAARKAGFANADAIGPFMRTLIATHRDTLGPVIAIAAR